MPVPRLAVWHPLILFPRVRINITEDLPDLEYPFVEGLALGHSMQFSGPLSLTMYGRHTLSRILLVLTYK